MTQVGTRPIRAAVAAAFVAIGLCAFPPGCGTDAQGVDTCRTIEQERCRQALSCPDQFHLTTEDQVGDCVRFYRDQCLHGLSNADVGGPQLDQCVQTIRKAGSCAAGGAKTLAECNDDVSQQTILAVSPCDLIVHPEEAIECSFLGAPPVQPTFDAATEQPPPDAAEEPGADAAASAPDASDETPAD